MRKPRPDPIPLKAWPKEGGGEGYTEKVQHQEMQYRQIYLISFFLEGKGGCDKNKKNWFQDQVPSHLLK